jgi:hypothetical protein
VMSQLREGWRPLFPKPLVGSSTLPGASTPVTAPSSCSSIDLAELRAHRLVWSLSCSNRGKPVRCSGTSECEVSELALPFESSPALVLDHKVGFERASNSEELAQQLCSIPGVGPWTEQYVAMRAIGDPDAFPTGDLGLLRGLRLKNARELERRAEVWRTSRAYAAMYIWSR